MLTEPSALLRRHLIARGHAALAAGRERFAAVRDVASALAAGAEVRRLFARYFGEWREELAAVPWRARLVGRAAAPGCRIQNVLFESHAGWEVNASLFLPADVPPPWPAVVVPVGHSGKHQPAYQLSCQYFARSGLAAVVFDPPGVAGEKQPGNDHFADGVRCHLVGDTSSRWFVGDVLRAMDWLATRDDMDLRHGIALTGVSGGGHSALYAALLDERATLVAPSCCLAPQGSLVLDRAYASCPETLMPGRLRDGLDDVDLLRAVAPRPVLLMAGAQDEVYRIEESRAIARVAAEHWARAGTPGRFVFFEDPGGHDYSLAQARRFVGFVREQWRLPAATPLPEPRGEDFPLLAREELSCRPNPAVNMRSLTRARAGRLARSRVSPTTESLGAWLGIDPAEPPRPCAVRRAPERTWFHDWSEWVLESEPGIEVPFTMADPGPGAPALVHLDDSGRFRLAAHGGPLMDAIGHLDRHGPKAALLTADLRGWGETAMAPSPYEMVSWGAPERFAAYVGAAVGELPAAGRILDAWRLMRAQPLRPRTVLSACGAAGPVALHVAALLPGHFAAVVLLDSPASYAALLETNELHWPHDLVLPGVLQHHDLPDLAPLAGCPVHWLNPLDGARRPAAAEVSTPDFSALLHRLLHE